jgi:hypothetical protein|tara:strand:+ start:288 stop:482 length:195 start_codon:yes stop_codon:yes gene_type:complete
MTDVTLNTTERNVLQVAVDHLIEHLSDTLIEGLDRTYGSTAADVRYVTQRLVLAAMLKERLSWK